MQNRRRVTICLVYSYLFDAYLQHEIPQEFHVNPNLNFGVHDNGSGFVDFFRRKNVLHSVRPIIIIGLYYIYFHQQLSGLIISLSTLLQRLQPAVAQVWGIYCLCGIINATQQRRQQVCHHGIITNQIRLKQHNTTMALYTLF